MKSNFNKFPTVKVSSSDNYCVKGWNAILERIKEQFNSDSKKIVIAIECYQGVLDVEVEKAFSEEMESAKILKTDEFFKAPEAVKKMVQPFVTNDRVFGFMSSLILDDFLDENKLEAINKKIENYKEGPVIIYGPGASKIAQKIDVLLYLDMARWEIQQRMRANKINNLGLHNQYEETALQYKQSYFVDWRVLDRHKNQIFKKCDYFIDTNKQNEPKMISGKTLINGLHQTVQQPFRVVPFFDSGVWGGQWLKEVMDLDRSAPNYAWGFDCVPEENSLLLQFGDIVFETPSINLVFQESKALLGKCVYDKFGAEFPIRFDFLDTVEGGNLSLQVHPTKKFIKEKFGMPYTQDESYYLMDAGKDACVYLGLQDEIEPDDMIQDLEIAENGGQEFNAEKYINQWPVKKHDHFLIPAGTVHCSGKNSVVLEISATPNIFTFKLWDWGRLGMDGKPRPINIDRGEKVIQWDRTTEWTKRNLINHVEPIAEGDGWKEEKTGLYEDGFIETRRHWFTKKTTHQGTGSVQVINLVEGKEVIVESPEGLFEPYVVHYAETFIIPATVKEYSISPYRKSKGDKCATIKAFVKC